jgi:PAS domain S-box-containing protein
LRREKGPAAASEFFQTGKGKKIVDQIADLSAEMDQAEMQLLADRSAHERRGARFALIASGAGVILNLFVYSFLFFWSAARSDNVTRLNRRCCESEERRKYFVEHRANIIYRTGRDGAFTFLNPAVETILGYPPDELVGRPALDLVASEWRKRVAKFYAEQIKKQILNSYYSFPVNRKDGSEIWLGQNVLLMKREGQVTGMQVMARDITRGVQLEEELERARDAALESARLKSEFLGNMSHEIRTPMNGIIGMTSLLTDTQLDKDQSHFVEGIRESADSLLAIINDLLDFSKIEAGKLSMELAEFELVPLVEGVVSLLPNLPSPGTLNLLRASKRTCRHMFTVTPRACDRFSSIWWERS